MLIKGSCEKQNLMDVIYRAILSPGSNWTEISSNKTNDYKYTGAISDGWVFKSPPIGKKQQSIFLTLKSLDLTVNPTAAVGNGGNHLFMWLSDGYEPNEVTGENGTHLNKSPYTAWCFCQTDQVYCSSTSIFDYFIDIEDHRIMILVQRSNETTTKYPQYIYIGYPEPNTNLEGEDYTNQFIAGSNTTGVSGIGYAYWHRASSGVYFKQAVTTCNLNVTNPTPMGLYLLNPILMNGDGISGMQSTGILGVLDGAYGLQNTNIVNGDIINVGDDRYQVFQLGQWSINGRASHGLADIYYYHSFTPSFIAIKIN